MERSGVVYEALDFLMNDLKVMGDAIANASEAYKNLYRRATLDKGRMSVRRVAKKLMEYGIAAPGKLKQLDKCEEMEPDGD